MLRRGEAQQPGDAVTPEEEIKDPYILEFSALMDEIGTGRGHDGRAEMVVGAKTP
jgi:hypothetical protein